jgi:hypothetical protein
MTRKYELNDEGLTKDDPWWYALVFMAIIVAVFAVLVITAVSWR